MNGEEINPRTDEECEAYDTGFLCRRSGRSDVNPYDRRSRQYKLWHQGWLNAGPDPKPLPAIMNKEEYRGAYEGRVGADRMALGLPIVADKLRGDMDEVKRLRDALNIARQYIGGEFGFDNWRIEKIDTMFKPKS